ncbi:MAG TPA: hypothetical protein VFQ51_09400 [Vicinamibacteria bacterium]|nr:hypothetical protein [Vicinamibacteria bacterium]
MRDRTGVSSMRQGLVWLPILGSVMASCAPVFSDLQSARLLDRGRVELTPSASHVRTSCDADDDCGHLQDNFGVQVGVGVHEAVELRARYEHVKVVEDGPSFEVVGIGPKLRLVEDHLALYVPIGRAFGGPEDAELGDSWQVHPTLLATAPLHRNVEVNASAKYLIPLNDGGDNLVAFNLGLGLGQLDKWAIRPEMGVMFDPGEDGRFYHFSLGVSFRPR